MYLYNANICKAFARSIGTAFGQEKERICEVKKIFQTDGLRDMWRNDAVLVDDDGYGDVDDNRRRIYNHDEDGWRMGDDKGPPTPGLNILNDQPTKGIEMRSWI